MRSAPSRDNVAALSGARPQGGRIGNTVKIRGVPSAVRGTASANATVLANGKAPGRDDPKPEDRPGRDSRPHGQAERSQSPGETRCRQAATPNRTIPSNRPHAKPSTAPFSRAATCAATFRPSRWKTTCWHGCCLRRTTRHRWATCSRGTSSSSATWPGASGCATCSSRHASRSCPTSQRNGRRSTASSSLRASAKAR